MPLNYQYGLTGCYKDLDLCVEETVKQWPKVVSERNLKGLEHEAAVVVECVPQKVHEHGGG